MVNMTKQKFVVLIEKDEDGIYIGTVPELKGCIAMEIHLTS
ncbi:type II toxin-antitoxin system HicB family antitoxin [Methanosarcina siciliae]|nr:type II toxin-antitoxin system HicB family antitoxin [Methanosarcina siciliae]